MRRCLFPTKSPTYVPSGRLWPSGDFSVGSKKIPGDEWVDWDTWEHWDSTKAIISPLDPGVYCLGLIPSLHGRPLPSDSFVDEDSFRLGAKPLDLADASNPHSGSKRPKSYGRLGITGFGRKMVRSACCILERTYRGRLTFATITMPTLSPELRVALAECWPEFVRQLLQWLSRTLARQGLPKAVASVSEVQPKRLQSGNGGYLHLHLVWPNRRMRKGHFAVDVDDCRAWVESFLLRRSLLPDGEWVNVDTQAVRKSAAAYLSKYMSKGGDVLEAFVKENGWSACPGQWWNMTKTMRDSVKAEMLQGEEVGEILRMVVEYAFNCNDFDSFWFLHHVDMEYEGRFISCGWFGALKEEVRLDVVQMFSLAAA